MSAAEVVPLTINISGYTTRAIHCSKSRQSRSGVLGTFSRVIFTNSIKEIDISDIIYIFSVISQFS